MVIGFAAIGLRFSETEARRARRYALLLVLVVVSFTALRWHLL